MRVRVRVRDRVRDRARVRVSLLGGTEVGELDVTLYFKIQRNVRSSVRVVRGGKGW